MKNQHHKSTHYSTTKVLQFNRNNQIRTDVYRGAFL